jgi:hypothetical protein
MISYNTSIVRSGLVLHLDAANRKSYPGSGTAWNDLSGNGRNGTLVNGVSYSGDDKGSMVFDGIDDRISSVTLPNPNGQLTCEVIMRYASKGTYHNIFDRGSSNPMFWITGSVSPNGANKIELNTGSGLVSDLIYPNQIIVATAIYRSDISPGIQLYINGTLVKTQNNIQTSWPNPFTVTLFNRNNGETFQGNIYSLKFYNRALSVTEIQQNFNALRGRYGI